MSNPSVGRIPPELLDKHYLRKHGKNAYYGQRYWDSFLHWKGWSRLFGIPIHITWLLFLGCAAALVWIFLNGLDTWWPAYILYILSAYSLIGLCIHLPDAIRWEKDWMDHHPKLP